MSMTRRSVEDEDRRVQAHPYLDGRIVSPETVGVLLVRSRYMEGCLTHLVRWAHVRDGSSRRPTFQLQCGAFLWNVRAVAVEDETFVCARCIENAERYGEPTYGMIPNTGCESSGGRRWRKRERSTGSR